MGVVTRPRRGTHRFGWADQRPRIRTAPDGLRPAQMGVVLLGRVILGHAVVTLSDLSARGFLSTEEIGPGPSCDWRIEVTTGPGPSGLLPFEQACLAISSAIPA